MKIRILLFKQQKLFVPNRSLVSRRRLNPLVVLKLSSLFPLLSSLSDLFTSLFSLTRSSWRLKTPSLNLWPWPNPCFAIKILHSLSNQCHEDSWLRIFELLLTTVAVVPCWRLRLRATHTSFGVPQQCKKKFVFVLLFGLGTKCRMFGRDPQALPLPQVTNHTSNATISGRRSSSSFFVGLGFGEFRTGFS